MTTFSHGEFITLYICSICTGSLSLLSSGTITIMIMISKDRLTCPFRRLIFGLSVADVIQSAAMIAGPFSLPKHQQGALWSNGSEFTCELQGFALHTGFAGVPMYVLSLSAYYLCAVRYNIKDRVFSKKVEPYLHAVSIIWTLGGGVACWSCGVFNMMASGNVCWYTPYPSNCLSNDDVECQRGKLAFTFGWLFGGSNAVTLCGIMYCLGGVIKTVRDQELKNKTYDFEALRISKTESESGVVRRVSSALISLGSSVKFDMDETSQSAVDKVPNSNGNKTIKSKRRAMQRTSVREASINQRYAAKTQQLKRETMTQSMLYIVAFLASCAWAYLYGFLVTVGIKVPFVICLFFSIFYPLGGVFNILVYTRPKIRSLRRKHKEVPWLRAFFEVIRAGVEVPQIIVNRSASDVASGSNNNSSSRKYSSSVNEKNSYSFTTDDPYNSRTYSEFSHSQNLPKKFSEEDEDMINSTSSKNDSSTITDDDTLLNTNSTNGQISNEIANGNKNKKNQGTHTKGDVEHGNSHDITTKLDIKPSIKI